MYFSEQFQNAWLESFLWRTDLCEYWSYNLHTCFMTLFAPIRICLHKNNTVSKYLLLPLNPIDRLVIFLWATRHLSCRSGYMTTNTSYKEHDVDTTDLANLEPHKYKSAVYWRWIASKQTSQFRLIFYGFVWHTFQYRERCVLWWL